MHHVHKWLLYVLITSCQLSIQHMRRITKLCIITILSIFCHLYIGIILAISLLLNVIAALIGCQPPMGTDALLLCGMYTYFIPHIHNLHCTDSLEWYRYSLAICKLSVIQSRPTDLQSMKFHPKAQIKVAFILKISSGLIKPTSDW